MSLRIHRRLGTSVRRIWDSARTVVSVQHIQCGSAASEVPNGQKTCESCIEPSRLRGGGHMIGFIAPGRVLAVAQRQRLVLGISLVSVENETRPS